MRSVRYFAGLSSLCLLLAACQPVEGDSLLTDKQDDSSTHTLDKTPKSEELTVQLFSPTINMKNTDTKAEITGECYVSTYPSHRLIVMNGSTQMALVDTNPATAANANYATCKNGRFNFSLNIASLASGVYSMRIIMQAFDADGNAVMNEARAAPTFTLTK
ncbi:hypothetical protein ACNQKP_14395 [Bdellovibrio bacteriovorus]|uniref:hypothetical protein n=1 Tax=Bdellovibrio bacteriovorus TaxID=959 RepID=UPI003AA8A52B